MSLPPELDFPSSPLVTTKKTIVTPSPRPSTAASSSSSSNGTNSSGGGGGGGRKFFGFWRSKQPPPPHQHKRGTSGNTLESQPLIGSSASSTSSTNGLTTPTAAAAAGSPTSATSAPRRKWLRYPVRVPILSLLLVSLLARSSEGWTSICGFLCGFLLFESFSAPDTGQPNRIDTIVRRLVLACKKCRGKKKRTKREKQEQRSRLSALTRFPFTWCCRRRPRHAASDSTGSTVADTDPLAASSLLSTSPPQAEEDTDVLLDVAVSVSENGTADANEASAVSTTTGADASTGSNLSPPSTIPSAIASTASSSSSSSSSATGAPLHPLHSLTDSLTDTLKDSISEALPTVTSLDENDVRDEVDGAMGAQNGAVGSSSSGSSLPSAAHVSGARVSWAHMSISLRFTIRDFHIHLHHWVYLLIICLFLYLEQNFWRDHAASYPVYAFASAFCLGGSVQGLKYADWANVIWRKKKEQQQQEVERRNSRTTLHDVHETDESTQDPSSIPPLPYPAVANGSIDRQVSASDRVCLLTTGSYLDEGLASDSEEEEEESEIMPPPLPLSRVNSAPTIADIEAQAHSSSQREHFQY